MCLGDPNSKVSKPNLPSQECVCGFIVNPKLLCVLLYPNKQTYHIEFRQLMRCRVSGKKYRSKTNSNTLIIDFVQVLMSHNSLNMFDEKTQSSPTPCRKRITMTWINVEWTPDNWLDWWQWRWWIDRGRWILPWSSRGTTSQMRIGIRKTSKMNWTNLVRWWMIGNTRATKNLHTHTQYIYNMHTW